MDWSGTTAGKAAHFVSIRIVPVWLFFAVFTGTIAWFQGREFQAVWIFIFEPSLIIGSALGVLFAASYVAHLLRKNSN